MFFCIIGGGVCGIGLWVNMGLVWVWGIGGLLFGRVSSGIGILGNSCFLKVGFW